MVYRTTKDIQEKKDEKRRLILNTASKVFAKDGYHLTSVKDIVDEANISVGSFYFYFKNKEQLFETLYDEMINSLLDIIQLTIDDNSLSDVEKVCRSIFLALDMFEKNKELSKIVLINSVGLNPDFERKRWDYNKKLLDMIERNMTVYQKAGLIKFPDLKIAALAYGGAIFAIITDWLHGENAVKLIEYTYAISIFVMQGIKIEFDNSKVENYIYELKGEAQGGNNYV